MILCIGTTPAAQRVMRFAHLDLDAVNRAQATTDGIAGKSINVAKVLHELGGQPIAVGFAGGDRGRELLQGLSIRGIQNQFVEVPARTRQCITILDQSSHTVTELVEESRPVAQEHYQALRGVITRLLPGCRAVVMSGSLTPGGPVEFYRDITEAASANAVLSMVDAQGAPLAQALAAHPDLVKPNRQELAATVMRSLKNDSEVIEAMREVHQRGAARVVVTAGKAPTLALDGEHLWRIETTGIRVVNPIGSGDAFTAALVWSLVRKRSLGEACRWAAAAGAANALGELPGELKVSQVQELAEQVTVVPL
jgi:1-phosphofructokinase family hexose kinase